jgi:hypothetical protein
MRAPEPLRTLWAPTGAILNIGNASIALVLGVISYGFIGIVGLIAAAAVLIAIELARYSLRMEDATNAATATNATSQAVLSERETELETSQERGRKMESELVGLRSELQSDRPSLARVTSVLWHAHDAVTSVLRRRRLASKSGWSWPIIRIVLSPDGDVEITADVLGADEAAVAAETLGLIRREDSPIRVEATGTDSGRVFARCLLEDLPPEIASTLAELGTIDPSDFRLSLHGLSHGSFETIDTDLLDGLRIALAVALESAHGAMQPEDVLMSDETEEN